MIDASVLPDLLRNAGWRIEIGSRTATPAELTSSARRYAARFASFPAGSGVLVCVSDPVEALSVAMGAWWAGLRVAFERTDSPLSPDGQATTVAASIRVVDGGAAGGVAAGVAVVPHAELSGAPVSWGPRCSPGDLALDAISSGTTGVPKCVVFTHSAVVANAAALAEAMAVRAEDRIWTCLPHGLSGVLCTVTLAAACRSATAVLSEFATVTGAVRALGAASASVVYAVPEVYEVLARMPPAPDQARRTRLWLSSSGVLSPALFDLMREKWGAVVRSFYCGSEFGTATFNDEATDELVRASVGRPLAGVSIGIDARRGAAETAGPGAPMAGQVTVQGALIGYGYRTAGGVVPFPPIGVVTTDLGTLDSDGLLRLHGRTDGHIHVGAEVVDPRVVETLVESIQGVRACEVVPRKHPFLGQVLEARVRRTAGVLLTERDIIAGCRKHGLSGGWVPRKVSWIAPVASEQAGTGGIG